MGNETEVRIIRVLSKRRGARCARCLFSDGSNGLVPVEKAMPGYYWVKSGPGRCKGSPNKKGRKGDVQ